MLHETVSSKLLGPNSNSPELCFWTANSHLRFSCVCMWNKSFWREIAFKFFFVGKNVCIRMMNLGDKSGGFKNARVKTDSIKLSFGFTLEQVAFGENCFQATFWILKLYLRIQKNIYLTGYFYFCAIKFVK